MIRLSGDGPILGGDVGGVIMGNLGYNPVQDFKARIAPSVAGCFAPPIGHGPL